MSVSSLINSSELQAYQPTFRLMPLPWNRNALSPFLSEKSITLIYDGYYHNHVDKMNALVVQYPELRSQTLGQIVMNYPMRSLFNNIAAEILNHEFFFRCLTPSGSGLPAGRIYQTIVQQFKSFENFVKQFTEIAVNHFGSGWIWLVFDPTTTFLMIVDGDNAYNPILDGYVPLLTLDIWEHAYLLDYGFDKLHYVNNFWKFISWNFIEQLAAEQIFGYQVRV